MTRRLVAASSDRIRCPKCGSGEMHPTADTLLVRALKVCDEHGQWWSHCLVCAGYYNADLTAKVPPAGALNPTLAQGYNPEKGWFKS
jgi:hypothetical protein